MEIDAKALQAKHGSTQAWYADFVDRLSRAVSQRIDERSTRSPYLFQHDEDVSIKEMDPDKTLALFFGETFEVINEYTEDDYGYLFELDSNLVNETIKEITRRDPDFSDEFTLLAQSMDLDEHVLLENLADEEDLSVSELDAHVHSYDVKFSNSAAAYMHLCQFTLKPEYESHGDDLFSGLKCLRIPISDYIAAIKVFFSDRCVHEGGEYLLSANDLQTLGIEIEDDEQDAQDDLKKGDDAQVHCVSWEQAYEESILQNYEKYRAATGINLDRFSQPSVISASDLIAMTYEKDGSAELYLHVTLDSGVLEEFSMPMNGHFYNDAKLAVVHSGYLSTEETAGWGAPWAVDIQAPLIVDTDFFRICAKGERPEHTDDRIELPLHRKLFIDLHKACHEFCKEKARSPKADDKLEEAFSVGLQRIVNRAPWWARQIVSEVYLPQLNEIRSQHILDALNAPPSEQDLTLGAHVLREFIDDCKFATLTEGAQPSMLEREIKALVHIIPPTALAIVDKGELCSTFELACMRLAPPDILLDLPRVIKSNVDNGFSSINCLLGSILNNANDSAMASFQALVDSGADLGKEHLSHFNSVLFRNPAGLGELGRVYDYLLNKIDEKFDAQSRASLMDRMASKYVTVGGPLVLLAGLLERGLDPANLLEKIERSKPNPESWHSDIMLERLDRMQALTRSFMAKDIANDVLREFSLQP